MSQLGDYEDMVELLERNLERKPEGKGLSVDADFVLASFGQMKCMDFVFDVFDKDSDSYIKDWETDYPLCAEYMRNLSPYNK